MVEITFFRIPRALNLSRLFHAYKASTKRDKKDGKRQKNTGALKSSGRDLASP